MADDVTDRDLLVARLADQAWIDDPFAGFVDPDGARAASPVWPDARWADCAITGRLETAERDVWEVRLTRDDLAVPVAVVFDATAEDARARLYYDKEAFHSAEPRRPVIAPDGRPLPVLVQRYRDAVRAADAPALAALVHPDAVIVGPPGRIDGAGFVEAITRAPAVGSPGVPLEICTVTSVGTRYAAEFISWRRPPHAGIGVYEFVDDLLVAARLYEGPVRR
jgi:hypothetical protein